MGRSTVHYADNETNNILKRLHNKLRPAGTPVERVEYIIELLLLRIFEVKLKQDEVFAPLRKLFKGENYRLLFSYLLSLSGEQILTELNDKFFKFYAAILSHARTVVSGNPPAKMQDQLVLMEEVFANSNFTNNVKGGVLAEVIGLINDVEEKMILKTDLLGDAIESALSETGGTKDIGLFRTPGHIRRMMVEMADPDFNDIIFDPACGTAGFLFDAYDFVIDKAQKSRKFPSTQLSTQFYRTGLGGIEYLGRIRKMAAVNMYIRGLNPHNIEQGDALKLFDPARDSGSKSVVIANPPFGAERDQPAYPNVWEEYSKESETTILFVKLMFELLKTNGRCAVVVSEGLLTWNQNSACALRKLLLQEANLKAVISLPQGVFVSKGGQGAKTSILYFEKGKPTEYSWFYRIENDGFSMGTNRKPIEGNQIPELLSIFKLIKTGKKPDSSRNSYSIPREWIETLDPRIKDKIATETRARLNAINTEKRKKLEDELLEKFESNKISKPDMKEKLQLFDAVAQTQLENEIARRIENAHTFHWNLQNYRSSLLPEQIKEWKELLKKVKVRNGTSLDKRYAELKEADAEKALGILAGFNPENAVEMDIARELLNKKQSNTFVNNPLIQKLNELLHSGSQYPLTPICDFVFVNDDKFRPSEEPETIFTVLGVSNQIGVFVNEKLRGNKIKQAYFRVKQNEFCYNPYRINVGSIGLNRFDYDHQIISGAYNIFGVNESELLPEYLLGLFYSTQFNSYVNEKANGGVRMDFKIDDLKNWKIPLPSIDIQRTIATEIEKQKEIIDSASKIFSCWSVDQLLEVNYKEHPVSEFAQVDGSPIKELLAIQDEIYIGGENIESGTGRIINAKTLSDSGIFGPSFVFKKGHVVYSKVRPSLQKCFYATFEGVCSSDIYPLKVNSSKIHPEYLAIVLMSNFFANKTLQFQDGRSGMPKINQDQLAQIKIPLPPVKNQFEIIRNYNQQIQILDGLRFLSSQAESRITRILSEIWGE